MGHAVFERLMAQPELLATLAESIQSQKGLSDSGLQTSPAVQLVSQSVEIIVAPKADTSSPRSSAGDRSGKKTWSIPVYDVDPEEEKVVNAMRLKELVGKTITGTFFMKDQPPHVKHWIRWNEKKCDNVYIPQIWPSQYSEVSPSRALKLSALSQHWVPIPPPRGESTLNARHSRSYRKATFLRCIPGPTYPKADPSEASQAHRLTPQPLTR